jgi:hypothetical protein
MRNRRFTITQWEANEHSENLDIDWPRVQREAGREHVEWLLKQSHTQCQILLESNPKSTVIKLVAEFYDDKLAVNYALLWAK